MSKRAKKAETKKGVNGLSRREFIKNAGIIAGGAAVVGAVGCAPAEVPKPWIPAKWDYVADVVVVGFGGGGSAAAVAAYDKGAKVIILEKAPEQFAGGNTRVCCGGMSFPPSFEQAIKHFTNISMGTVSDEEVIRGFTEELLSIEGKLRSYGIELPKAIEYGSYGKILFVGKTGGDLWKQVASLVRERKIEILYETPVTELYQDPATKEILGVKATDKGGQIISVKANRGVVLSCGGYENNPELQGYFNLPGMRAYPWGTPYNTGDGIKMVQSVGAQLWHLYCLEWAPFSIKGPSEQYQVSFSLPTNPFADAGYIFVNTKGNRFMNEVKSLGHTKEQLVVNDITASASGWATNMGYANIPFYMVYDKKLQDQGAIWGQSKNLYYGMPATYAMAHKIYEWSADNSAEIAKGWIKKADSINELAGKAGIDAAGLQASIDKYNAFCKAQLDSDFNKPKENLLPIDTPPYYITELALTCINTQGGPQHNAKHEVVDKNYKPIKRLYAAGEFGSFYGAIYHGATNFPESFASGFVCGENAAALTPWDKVS